MRKFILLAGSLLFAVAAAPKVVMAQKVSDRQFWIAELDRIARPVMRSLAHDSLRINMPTTVSIHIDNAGSRRKVAYLEILGRTLSGIAPWLQLEGGSPAEQKLRNQYREWALQGVRNALDSNARDFMRFDIAGQQLVDASYLALAFIRAPWLWQHLDTVTRQRLVAGAYEFNGLDHMVCYRDHRTAGTSLAAPDVGTAGIVRHWRADTHSGGKKRYARHAERIAVLRAAVITLVCDHQRVCAHLI